MGRPARGGSAYRIARILALVAALGAAVGAAAALPMRSVAGEAEAAGERIVRVVVRGNVRVTTHRILGQMRLREGSTYSPAAVDEDLKRIHALGEFDNVVFRPEKTADGLALVVEVTERPVLEKLLFEGNRKFSEKDLAEAVGVSAGSLLDRNKVFQGARAIERKYHDAGYRFARVALDEVRLASSREARYVITEGPHVRVSKVTFTGNPSIGARELEGRIETRAYFPIFSAGTYDEEQIGRDVTAIRNYYIDQGFLDVKVDRELVFNADKTRLAVRFMIEEGPCYKVRSVSLDGVKRFAPSYLQKLLQLAPGVPYTADRVARDLETVRDEYGENGYVDAAVRPAVDFTDETALVDVTIRVDEGAPVKIGEIRVEGNRLTQDKVVRRELRFFPEEPVNTKLIEKARRRLEGTGLYKPGSVQITTIPTASAEVVDVLVRVEETETANLILGAGISSNSGLLGNISLVQRNFDLADWPKSPGDFWRGEAFRGAGQLFQIVLEPGTQLQRYRIDFREPHIGGSEYSLSTSLFLFERNRDSYDERRVGLNFGFGRELKEDLQAFLNFRLEGIDIGSIDADAPRDVRKVKGSSGLTSVELGLVKDTTDSLLFPSEGYRASASVEQAGALGGSYTFTKVVADGRRYWTVTRDVLDRRSVLALHGRVGHIFGDAPIFERFFAGGQGSIRGFEYRGVGPRKNDTAVGGDFIALASAEYQFPIFEKTLSGVLFLDTGTVERNLSIGTWRASVGFGVRFTVPFFGPVPFALDFGFPIAKDGDDETEIFAFSIGTAF
ncbi:MAG: outer membrane protein assembly factor BamA [Planctomycetes bacterium]|nr:outer membrane protein assembly factor BamA [Planctomycetota bacterium]